MPIIRSHHKNDPWRPVQAWPDDCVVQWGRSGVVFGQKDAYTTGFFEAFPQDGSAGFIRGEGATLEEAELKAFTSWQRKRACHAAGGHQWSRARRLKGHEDRLRGGRQVPKVSTYTNGGAFCLGCGAFQTALKPVHDLEEWKRPLSFGEMEAIMSGLLRPDPRIMASETEEERKRSLLWRRRLELRARMFGIDLPDHRLPKYQRPEDLHPFAEDDYMLACGQAVVRYYLSERQKIVSQGGRMEALFDAMTRRRLDEMADGLELSNAAGEPTPGAEQTA